MLHCDYEISGQPAAGFSEAEISQETGPKKEPVRLSFRDWGSLLCEEGQEGPR